MPLKKSKSNAAFSSNVKAEMNAGKPQNQALAIAYSVKRKAKKMAMGGMIEDSEDKDNFLSAEGAQPDTFSEGASDEEELDKSGFLPAAHMDNQQDNNVENESRAEMVARIMRRIRR